MWNNYLHSQWFKERIDLQMRCPSENCNLVKNFNGLGDAAICCEYFQDRREESIIRSAVHRCSVILTSDLAHMLSTYGNSGDIYPETRRRVALDAHLSPQQLLSLSAINKLIWEDHFDISRPFYHTPWETLNLWIIISSIEALLLVSSAITVGSESHFVFFANCVSQQSQWERKEPG